MDAGRRDRLITFQRQGAGTDDGYTTQPGAFADYAQAWARVRFGTGQERREAAQERVSMAATFECLWNPTLNAVLETDRIVFDGANWDIVSRALVNRDQIHFAAVKSV